MNKKLFLVLTFAVVCWALFFTSSTKAEDKGPESLIIEFGPGGYGTEDKGPTLSGFGGAFFDALDGKGASEDKGPLLDKSLGLWDAIYTDLFYHGFRWDWHIELCASNRALDSINGEGSFDKRLKASVEAGGMPCPTGGPNHPSWAYDWKGHIDKQRLLKVTETKKPIGRMGIPTAPCCMIRG